MRLATYGDVVAVIDELPTDAYFGEDRIDAVTLDAVLESAMYDPFNWGFLSTALEDADVGDASTLDALADLHRVSNAYFTELVDLRFDGEAIANSVIFCADFQAHPDRPDYCDGVPRHERVVPELGAVDLAEPVLVIGTAYDFSTPAEHTAQLADRLGDAVELYWDGIGHTAFASASFCINEHVAAYVLDGTLPDERERCDFVEGIEGDPELADYLFALPPSYVEPWIAEEIRSSWGRSTECGADRLSHAGDRVVTHIVLGLDSEITRAALAKAAMFCDKG